MKIAFAKTTGIIALLLIYSSSAFAQGGCTDSPEASTDVLMLVGSVGMIYGSHFVRMLVTRSRR